MFIAKNVNTCTVAIVMMIVAMIVFLIVIKYPLVSYIVIITYYL